MSRCSFCRGPVHESLTECPDVEEVEFFADGKPKRVKLREGRSEPPPQSAYDLRGL